VSGRKQHKIKIDSFAYILLFFSSAVAAFWQAQCNAVQRIACPEKSGKTLKNYYDWINIFQNLFKFIAVRWKIFTLRRIVCSTCLQMVLKTIGLVFHKCHSRSVWDYTAKDELSCGSVWNIDDLMVRSIRLRVPLIFLLTLVHFFCVSRFLGTGCELPLVCCFVFYQKKMNRSEASSWRQ